MPYVPRPWFYAVDGDTFAAHVRVCSYGALVALRDELEDTIESCARVPTAGAALAVNERRMAMVDAELGSRANATLRADLRDRR
jgi:hypothetical protein